MKICTISLLALLPIVAAAADQPTLTFPDQKIGAPPLSLAEIGKRGPLGVVNDARVWFRRQSPSAIPARKFVSNMPLITPKDGIDPKLLKIPDFSIDYKLIVKDPDIEQAK